VVNDEHVVLEADGLVLGELNAEQVDNVDGDDGLT
jgi:hypothetical protein